MEHLSSVWYTVQYSFLPSSTMNGKKVSLILLGVASLFASALMFIVGSNNGHLTELLQFFWIPIPLGLLLIWAGATAK